MGDYHRLDVKGAVVRFASSWFTCYHGELCPWACG